MSSERLDPAFDQPDRPPAGSVSRSGDSDLTGGHGRVADGGRGRITEVPPLGAQALDIILHRRSVGGIRDTGAGGDSMTSATRCEGIETAETMQGIIETAAEPAKLHDVVNAALEERPGLGTAFGTIVEPEQKSAGPDPG